jgi:hypothetical protein
MAQGAMIVAENTVAVGASVGHHAGHAPDHAVRQDGWISADVSGDAAHRVGLESAAGCQARAAKPPEIPAYQTAFLPSVYRKKRARDMLFLKT